MGDNTDSDVEVPPENGNRATVALTLSEVRGLKELTNAGFANVQRQLDAMATVPLTVAQHDVTIKDHERRLVTLETDQVQDNEQRLSTLEDERESSAEWRRTHMPTIALSVAMLAVAIVTLVINLH